MVCRKQGPRFDCWISVHTLKKASKEGGDGGEGEKKKSVGQLCLWQLVAFFCGGSN
jgi:hypothetical protein